MRDLTQKEIDQASDWAVRYNTNTERGNVCYMNGMERIGIWGKDRKKFILLINRPLYENSNPIPIGKFNIEALNINDSIAELRVIQNAGKHPKKVTGAAMRAANKLQVIAKHLKLTPEDLK